MEWLPSPCLKGQSRAVVTWTSRNKCMEGQPGEIHGVYYRDKETKLGKHIPQPLFPLIFQYSIDVSYWLNSSKGQKIKGFRGFHGSICRQLYIWTQFTSKCQTNCLLISKRMVFSVHGVSRGLECNSFRSMTWHRLEWSRWNEEPKGKMKGI